MDTGEIRQRTEVIASEVIFLGGIQQSSLPPDYFIPEGDGLSLNADDDTADRAEQDAPGGE